MNIFNYKLYYFIGIGGIGMSAIARFFNYYKKKVVGYDKNMSELTILLNKEGISCHYNENIENLDNLTKLYLDEEILVIYTPAISVENLEYQYFKSKGYKILKRSMVLGEISKQFKTIAIAGTHGKTTITTLLSHILKCANINIFSFMGGISKNYNTNLLLGNLNDKDAYFIVEADEYDRSFLTLNPSIALISSVDADHLDIYKDVNKLKESYELFAKNIKPQGLLIVKKNVDNQLNLSSKHIIYSLDLGTEYCAESILIENAFFIYNIKSPIEAINDVTLGLSGLHNVENSIAAVVIAQQIGVKKDIIKEALRSFSGVKRRFDYRIKTEKIIYIDDYAHHPEELKATINSVKLLYPNKKITGIFQPHLFSRTRDFADDFACSLDLLDECILLEIYPARENPIEGINSSWLLNKMKLKNKKLLSKIEAVESIKKNKPELILTLGAGDIDSIIEPLEKIIKENYF